MKFQKKMVKEIILASKSLVRKKILEEKKVEFEAKKESERQQLMIDYLLSKGYSIQKPNHE